MRVWALIFVLLAAGTACAQPPRQEELPGLLPITRAEQMAHSNEHRREYTFERTDADDDGLISRAEWAERNWAFVRRYDADHNSLMTASEFATSVCPVPMSGGLMETDLYCIRGQVRRLRGLDTSRDGLLSRAEHARASEGYFRQADLCPDGVLQEEELNGDIRRLRKTCEQIRR